MKKCIQLFVFSILLFSSTNAIAEEVPENVSKGIENYVKAIKFYQSGDYAKAEEYYDKYKKSLITDEAEDFYAKASRFNQSGDYIKSAEYYGKAITAAKIKAGHFKSLVELGMLYEKGLGVPQDYTQALKLYEAAKDHIVFNVYTERQRLGEVLFRIAYLTEHGLGKPKDYISAVEGYHQAIAFGYTDARVNLDALYRGQGASQDYSKALKWYKPFAEMGEPISSMMYGHFYENGLGVPKNIIRSAAHMIIAEKNVGALQQNSFLYNEVLSQSRRVLNGISLAQQRQAYKEIANLWK